MAFDAIPTLLPGDVVLLHGTLRLQLRRAGETETVSATSWASALWLRDAVVPGATDEGVDGDAEGSVWRLRLFQSTKTGS
jgi:hypothetical protein